METTGVRGQGNEYPVGGRGQLGLYRAVSVGDSLQHGAGLAREFDLHAKFPLILAPMQLIQIIGGAVEDRACRLISFSISRMRSILSRSCRIG